MKSALEGHLLEQRGEELSLCCEASFFLYKSLPKGKKTKTKQPTPPLESRGNKVTNETKLVHEGLWLPSHHFPTE